MEETNYLFTSESVTEGHPDKVCDQISDAILDSCLEQDPFSRVAVECLITVNKLIIAGEITTKASVNYENIARQVIKDIGYTTEESGFDGDNAEVEVLIHTQSPDIAQGVDVGGAGDQGIMFGYAVNENYKYLPSTLEKANALTYQLTKLRKDGTIPYLLPDGKSQVTLEYTGSGLVKKTNTIVISAQHKAGIAQEKIRKDIYEQVIKPIFPELDSSTVIHINPTGSFIIGGPTGDTGVTGRKIIVDTYGGAGRHGGGAFSGKDPTKVDRSGAYIARYLAKNIVANKLSDKCEIQLSYAIGVEQPVSIFLEDFGTAKVSPSKIIKYINENFDLSPSGIINFLNLRRPIYRETAAYGHFGPDNYPREKIEKRNI